MMSSSFLTIRWSSQCILVFIGDTFSCSYASSGMISV